MEKEQLHWDRVYSKTVTNKLGWYEEDPKPSINLIEKCNLDKMANILDVGSGTTTLIEKLIGLNYKNITALDISKVALETAKNRIQHDTSVQIDWICDDITDPQYLQLNQEIDLWHDRTVLHFLTEKEQQIGYLATLKKSVKLNGYAVIAVFALGGAKKCSGLNIKNYDHKMIADYLGSDFSLIENFEYIYFQPSGDKRPFVYTLFQRKNI